MFEFSWRARLIAGGAVGVSLLAGTAAVAGVMPWQDTGDAQVQVAAAAVQPQSVEAAVAEVVAQPAPETTVAPGTTVPATTPTTKPRTTTTKAAPVTTAPPATTAATATPGATQAAASTATTLPPRRNPSSAEIQAAMQQLKAKIGGLLAPNEAQARQFGGMVCDAFDQGKTYAQVKATAMQEVAKIPLVTVTSDTADFALKTAIQLFCPGHASKLP